MFIYYFVFVVLAILSFIELFSRYPLKYKKFTVFLFGVLYVILSTVYDGTMGDCATYKEAFYDSGCLDFVSCFSSRFEPLYSLLSMILYRLGCEYFVMRFVLATIVMIMWGKIYTYNGKLQLNKYMITILFVVWALQLGNILIIRSTVASTFCLFSIRYIEKKEVWKFGLCILIASGFHYFALIWVLAYPLYHIKKSREIFFIIGFCVVFLFKGIENVIYRIAPYFGQYISNRMFYYLSQGTTNTYGNHYNSVQLMIKAVLNSIVLIAIFLMTEYILNKRKEVEDAEYKKMVNLYLFGFIIYMCSFVTSITFNRFAVPFMSVQYFLLPKSFEILKGRNNLALKFAMYSFVCIYLLLRMYVMLHSGDYDFKSMYDF